MAVNGRTAAVAAASIVAGLAARRWLRRSPDGDLAGDVVLITGGSRGLGLELARAFAGEGCRLALCARDEGELRRARADLERRGAEVLTTACDVADREQVERFISEAFERYGQVDILVNNAGIIQVGPVESMTLEDFREAMDVMFWGTVYPTMAVLPHMLERGSGRIVNITSIGGKVAVPHLLPYNCAKFAAVGFSEGLAAEVKSKGVRVVTIAPGLMRTGSFLNAFFKGDAAKESGWFSLSASAPLLSMSSRRAARQIVEATRRGQAEKVLTAPASALARFHGLFPGTTTEALALAAKLLLPEGRGRRKKRGSEALALRGPALKALLLLGRLAARRLHQRPGPRPALAR